jgi:predicted transcriptional regulator
METEPGRTAPKRKGPQTMGTTLGTYIRARRRHLGLSQEQLAERVGETYSQADISHLECGGLNCRGSGRSPN